MHFTLNMMVNDKVFTISIRPDDHHHGGCLCVFCGNLATVWLWKCVCLWLFSECGSPVRTGTTSGTVDTDLRVYDMGSLFISLPVVSPMERRGIWYPVAAAICTYGCSSQSTLCLFVCAIGVRVMECVCASCCPSGRTESLLQVIIIIFYRSSWALFHGTVWP